MHRSKIGNLEVKDLKTSFFVPAGEVKSVDGSSFVVDKGKILGIVGESGSGKSVTANAVIERLKTMTTKPIFLLDGDIVRRNLSSELGFSKHHRNLNMTKEISMTINIKSQRWDIFKIQKFVLIKKTHT